MANTEASMPSSTAPSEAEVLIVEDNPADARLLQRLIEESSPEPLHFTHVDGLEEARTWLEGHVADAVLLDLGLPDAQGLEGLEGLEDLATGGHGIPIVVISGNDDERIRREVVERGAVDFVLKDDMDPDRLARSLKTALEHSRLASELERARRAARLARAELAEVVTQLDVPAVVIAPDHRVVYANAAGGRLLGAEARRLRGTMLAVPLDRTKARRIELTDLRGESHTLEISAVPIHWRERPAYLVLLHEHSEASGTNDSSSHSHAGVHEQATLAAVASEISAHALRLGTWLASTEDHHEKLMDIGRQLLGPPALDRRSDGVRRSRSEARRSVLNLARRARETLAAAQDDLVRVRRLAFFVQRSIGHGGLLELRSIDAMLDEVCRSVHARFGSDLHIVSRTHASNSFPAHAELTREILENLLVGLANTCRHLAAGALELRIRTHGAPSSITVSLEASPDRKTDEFRAVVLRELVGKADAESPRPELARSGAAVREIGGHLRFGSGAEGSFRLQIGLPDRQPN